jgi:hypothetical protein
LAATVATVHAAEDPRKITVVSFGLFGDERVFQREAIGAAQIVANRFGGDPVTVAAALVFHHSGFDSLAMVG